MSSDKELIKEVQRALKSRGYDPQGIDGIMGRNTISALRGFQLDAKLPIKWPGTLGPLTLKALGIGDRFGNEDTPNKTIQITPPWIVLARQKIGLHEKLNNKKLRDWLKSDGATLGDPSKLPWCGDFQETLIAVTLPAEPLPVNPYWALNWEKFGRALPKGQIPLGAIAPFKREGGGHIGNIVGHDKTHYHVLGGNQSNSISVVRIDKDRQSGGLRWPITYDLPSDNLEMTTINATVSENEA